MRLRLTKVAFFYTRGHYNRCFIFQKKGNWTSLLWFLSLTWTRLLSHFKTEVGRHVSLVDYLPPILAQMGLHFCLGRAFGQRLQIFRMGYDGHILKCCRRGCSMVSWIVSQTACNWSGGMKCIMSCSWGKPPYRTDLPLHELSSCTSDSNISKGSITVGYCHDNDICLGTEPDPFTPRSHHRADGYSADLLVRDEGRRGRVSHLQSQSTDPACNVRSHVELHCIPRPRQTSRRHQIH